MQEKRSRGRPPSLDPMYNIPTRFTRGMIDNIDACKLYLRTKWNDPHVTRGQAIRYLVDLGFESLFESDNFELP